MATKLENLEITEVSGVDDPANELPGWLMMKSKELGETIELVEKNASNVLNSLTNEYGTWLFSDADTEVKKALDTVTSYLQSRMEEDEAEDKAEGETGEEERPETKMDEEYSKSAPKSFASKLRDVFAKEESDTEAPAEETEAPAEETEAPAEETEAPAEETSDDNEAPDDEAADVEKTSTNDDAPEDDSTGDEAVANNEASEDFNQSEVILNALHEMRKEQESSADTLREAVSALADRLETVEKRTARRTGLPGQDVEIESVEKSSGLRSVIQSAATGRRITISD